MTLLISSREFHLRSLDPSNFHARFTQRWRRKCHRHRQNRKLVRVSSLSNLCLLTFNRFSVYKDNDLMDFVNAPVGKGLPISQSLRPLIAGNYPLTCSPQCDLTYF